MKRRVGQGISKLIDEEFFNRRNGKKGIQWKELTVTRSKRTLVKPNRICGLIAAPGYVWDQGIRVGEEDEQCS